LTLVATFFVGYAMYTFHIRRQAIRRREDAGLNQVQHAATHCNTPQHTATNMICTHSTFGGHRYGVVKMRVLIRCNTLQHAATKYLNTDILRRPGLLNVLIEMHSSCVAYTCMCVSRVSIYKYMYIYIHTYI